MHGYASEDSVQNQLFVHFGLRENPFGSTPDPRFLFHSETHREALASLINGIDFGFGFQMLVAQPGMGKTTLLFSFLERFRATAHTAFLFQPQLEPCELLQSLLFELGESYEDRSVRKLSEQLNQLLGRAAEEHKRVIVVMDEAQNLDFAVLETVRQLSNFETPQAKLMQIVLAGQPQLVKKLAAPEQEQLRQRISSIGRLSPLTLNETCAYINHRLRTAGYRGTDLFTLGAARKIWENAKGVPRNINTLCFNAMLLGSAGRTKSIDETILEEAVRDLDMRSIMADMYRIESSLVALHHSGNGKVQLIRETTPAETENAKPGNPGAAQGSMSQKAEINPAVAPSGNGNSSGAGENIPLALVEAIVRISQTIEEQKVQLAAKSVHLAEPLPATPAPAAAVQAPAALSDAIAAVASENPASSGQVSRPTPSAPGASATASLRSDNLRSGGKKRSPLKTEKTVPTEQKLATGTAPPQPEKTAAKPNVLSESPVVHSYHPEAKKPSDGGGFWLKTLALVAITCLLTIAVVEKSPWRRPAEANAKEDTRSASEQSDSGSGYSGPKQSPASPMDAPIRPSKGAPTNSPAPRDFGSDRFDEVTVRKFPAEPVAMPGASTGTQDPKSIFFDLDSAAIARRYRPALQQIADALARNPEASAILEGHTDDSGLEVYNLDLSSRRAIAVREALINDFNVLSTRLTAIGSGSAAPVQPNSSPAGRAYNRRVAVRFLRLGE